MDPRVLVSTRVLSTHRDSRSRSFPTTQASETHHATSRNDVRSDVPAARGARALRARSRNADTPTWTQPKRPERVGARSAQPESAADRISLDCGAIKAALVRSPLTRHRRLRGRESSTDISERALGPERTSTPSRRANPAAFAARGPTDELLISRQQRKSRSSEKNAVVLVLPLESP